MSLWFDSRRHEYAMDGKNGWFIKYCDKIADKLSGLCEEHFKGKANRHTADDVDYDEDMTVKERMEKEVADRKAADENIMVGLEGERAARAGADAALGKRIDAETSSRESGDAALSKRIDAEAEARRSADETLQDNIDSESEDLNNQIVEEKSERKNADTALGGRIDAEASSRESGDTALGGRIDKEIADRKSGSAALQNSLNSEISDRKAADDILQSSIDDLRLSVRGTMSNPIIVSEEELDRTWENGFYKSTIGETKIDHGDVNYEWIVAVTNYAGTGEAEICHVVQTMINEKGIAEMYRSASATVTDPSRVLGHSEFSEWTPIQYLDGTLKHPRILTGEEINFNTIIDPGVYYIDCDKIVNGPPHSAKCECLIVIPAVRGVAGSDQIKDREAGKYVEQICQANYESEIYEYRRILSIGKDQYDDEIYGELKWNLVITENHLSDAVNACDSYKKLSDRVNKIDEGTLKNPITVNPSQLAKTWKPGWYNCATIVLPGESGKAQSPNHLIRVTNQWDNEGGNWIVQTAYDWNGNASFYRRSVEGGIDYAKTLENHPFSATDDDWIPIVDNKDDPFVMHGTYDLTEHPGGITCMEEAASDNESWMLDYEIPPVRISGSTFGNIELKTQDVVYQIHKDSIASYKGKIFSVFAEYRRDDNYAQAKIIFDEHPICQKSYAVLRSAKELSFIRLYLGTATVKDISIGGPAGPDGAMTPSSADIAFTFSDQGLEGHNPAIYILNYGCMFDDKGGFNAGDQAEASDGGGAIGRLAKTTSGGAVGSEAESKNGFAGGYHVKVGGMGAAIGANAHAYHGGAAGSGAQAGNGFAGGMNAKCGTAPNGADVDCIQLGSGTNGNEKTLKVYDYQLTTLDAQGNQYLSDVGDISKLKTDDKTDIVSAINNIVLEIEEIKQSTAAGIN